MHASLLLVSALGASVLAAPTFPSVDVNAARPGDLDSISAYFNLLARKVQESKNLGQVPTCDITKAQLPTQPPSSAGSLLPVSQGLVLKHIAIGRGTQNYTCDNATAVPTQIGAVATLYDASCVAVLWPDVFAMLTGVSMKFNLSGGEAPRLAPHNLVISGHHYFDKSTPFFDLDTPYAQLGHIGAGKNGSEPAPANAPKGQQSEAAVPWLKLTAKPNMATGGLQEVYRVGTAGGSAPATCAGMPAGTFEVQYAAEYWFYYKPS
jgi:hypothetical protein